MENVQVNLRLRPLNENSKERSSSAWKVNEFGLITLDPMFIPNTIIKPNFPLSFRFDNCFLTSDTNDSIYEKSVADFTINALQGINTSILLYGQTGSGKTYTMLGDNGLTKKTEGILQKSLVDFFKRITIDSDKAFFVKCSCIEIYNDTAYDLLKPIEKINEPLMICEDSKKNFFMKGATEESVSSIEEVLQILKKSEENRHYAETKMNHASSRSHTLFMLNVKSISSPTISLLQSQDQNYKCNINNKYFTHFFDSDKKNKGVVVTQAVLNFVDLAGSEKVSHHMDNMTPDEFRQEQVLMELKENSGTDKYHRVKERVREGQAINKSLFFLTQVISLRAENKPEHMIPYRNSPLTKILKASLAGNSRTMIILCMFPGINQISDSLSTLRFGMSARKIVNNVETNILTKNENEAIKIIINDYEKKIRDFDKARQLEKEKNLLLEKKIEDLQSDQEKLLKIVQGTNIEKVKILFQQMNGNKINQSIKENSLTYVRDAGLILNYEKSPKQTRSYQNNKVDIKALLEERERIKFEKDALNNNFKNLQLKYKNLSEINEKNLSQITMMNNALNFMNELHYSLISEVRKLQEFVIAYEKNSIDFKLLFYDGFSHFAQLDDNINLFFESDPKDYPQYEKWLVSRLQEINKKKYQSLAKVMRSIDHPCQEQVVQNMNFIKEFFKQSKSNLEEWFLPSDTVIAETEKELQKIANNKLEYFKKFENHIVICENNENQMKKSCLSVGQLPKSLKNQLNTTPKKKNIKKSSEKVNICQASDGFKGVSVKNLIGGRRDSGMLTTSKKLIQAADTKSTSRNITPIRSLTPPPVKSILSSAKKLISEKYNQNQTKLVKSYTTNKKNKDTHCLETNNQKQSSPTSKTNFSNNYFAKHMQNNIARHGSPSKNNNGVSLCKENTIGEKKESESISQPLALQKLIQSVDLHQKQVEQTVNESSKSSKILALNNAKDKNSEVDTFRTSKSLTPTREKMIETDSNLNINTLTPAKDQATIKANKTLASIPEKKFDNQKMERIYPRSELNDESFFSFELYNKFFPQNDIEVSFSEMEKAAAERFLEKNELGVSVESLSTIRSYGHDEYINQNNVLEYDKKKRIKNIKFKINEDKNIYKKN